MPRFVVEYNNSGHGSPYGDRRDREIRFDGMTPTDPAEICSYICGWAWGHGTSVAVSCPDWTMQNADIREGFALCEMRNRRFVNSSPMFIRITGDLQVPGPW